MNLSKTDKIFSRYIRMRDCPNGKGRCISCGAVITPATCDAGHFIPRVHLSTRFDERNVNAQCLSCNRMQDGNIEGYKTGLIEKYGEQTIFELQMLKHKAVKFSKSDLKEIEDKYKL